MKSSKIKWSDIGLHNQSFWWYYFRTSFPNAYLEEEDRALEEIIALYEPVNEREWADDFTQFYDGVMAESDGYIENPATLETQWSAGQKLRIAFHPGDTIYYINNIRIGSTGPHWELQSLPYTAIQGLPANRDGVVHFLLLLPIVYVTAGQQKQAQEEIEDTLSAIFPKSICAQLAKCILAGLMQGL